MSNPTSDKNKRIAKNTLLLYFQMQLCMVVNEAMYIAKDVEITENIMSDDQYNEFLKAYTKEALANMIKADIRQRFPEPYASMYCQQFDN